MFEIKFRTKEGGWEEREVLEIWHKDKLIAEHYDAGEPEDNTFGRDWNWVPGAIEKAYKLGLQDKQDEWDHAYTVRITKENQEINGIKFQED